MSKHTPDKWESLRKMLNVASSTYGDGVEDGLPQRIYDITRGRQFMVNTILHEMEELDKTESAKSEGCAA